MPDITNFDIKQGETFKLQVQLAFGTGSVPLDITDYSFTGGLKENHTTDYPLVPFEITKITPYASGSIFIKLTNEQTEGLEQRKYVYDVYMRSGSIDTSRCILEGFFTVRPSATY